MHIGPFEIKNNCEKLFVIKVDSRLDFNEHLYGIIKKASRKINTLSRITPFMNISKRRILMKSFFNSQFNYCPVISMFHSRSVNSKINRLHKRVLHIVYSDFKSSSENLLEKDGPFFYLHIYTFKQKNTITKYVNINVPGIQVKKA